MSEDAKRTASAILSLSPSASSGVEGGEGADALLAGDRGLTVGEDQPVMEVDAEDRALTLASEDILTGVKTGDIATIKDALRNAFFALHPRLRDD